MHFLAVRKKKHEAHCTMIALCSGYCPIVISNVAKFTIKLGNRVAAVTICCAFVVVSNCRDEKKKKQSLHIDFPAQAQFKKYLSLPLYH